MDLNFPGLFGIFAMIPLVELVLKIVATVFVVYFLVSVMKFMKIKIKLDEQRIEQTNWFLKLYKSTNEKL